MTSAWNGLIAILKKSVVADLRTGVATGGIANGTVNGLGNALSAIRLVPVVIAVTVRSSGRATAPLTSTPILIKSRRVRVMRHLACPAGREGGGRREPPIPTSSLNSSLRGSGQRLTTESGPCSGCHCVGDNPQNWSFGKSSVPATAFRQNLGVS